MTDEEMNWLRREILDATAKYSKFVVPKLKKTGKNRYQLDVKCPYCREHVTFGNCLIKNRFIFGHILLCRKCGKLFYIVSLIEKIGYKNYRFFRSLRDMQKTLFRKLRLEGKL